MASVFYKDGKIEKFIIEDVKALTDKLDFDSQLFDAIMGDWDEEEKSIDWLFNPVITNGSIMEGMDIRDHGAEIIIHEEDDLPCWIWGVTIRGYEDDVAESLTDEFIGDEEIPADLYDYIKRQFKDNLPAMEV